MSLSYLFKCEVQLWLKKRKHFSCFQCKEWNINFEILVFVLDSYFKSKESLIHTFYAFTGQYTYCINVFSILHWTCSIYSLIWRASNIPIEPDKKNKKSRLLQQFLSKLLSCLSNKPNIVHSFICRNQSIKVLWHICLIDYDIMYPVNTIMQTYITSNVMLVQWDKSFWLVKTLTEFHCSIWESSPHSLREHNSHLLTETCCNS